jgi:hypothetical protein
MATTTFLSNATVNISQGATTYDISDQVRSVTLTVGYDSLEATSMGDTGRKYVQGLQAVSVSIECYLSYGGSGATSEIETMCSALVGQGNTGLVISPSGTTESPTNPEYTITNALLASFSPIASTVGELAMITLEFVGGTFARDIT